MNFITRIHEIRGSEMELCGGWHEWYIVWLDFARGILSEEDLVVNLCERKITGVGFQGCENISINRVVTS